MVRYISIIKSYTFCSIRFTSINLNDFTKTELNFLWAFHQTHHSGEKYTLAQAVRITFAYDFDASVSATLNKIEQYFAIELILALDGHEVNKELIKIWLHFPGTGILLAIGLVHPTDSIPGAPAAEFDLPILDSHGNGGEVGAARVDLQHAVSPSRSPWSV